MSQPSPFVLAPDAGEVLSIIGEKMTVLASTAATGGSCFVFIEETQPGKGPPLHRHAREDEFFYVLDGHFRFRVDGSDHDAPTGTFIFAPRGSLHAFANVGERPARLLIWTLPPAIEPAFRECDAQGLKPADAGRLAAVFGEVGVTFEGPPIG